MNIDPSEFLSLTSDPTPEQLDRLEVLLGYYNEVAAEGAPAVADDVYDRLKLLLSTYREDSVILSSLWDEVGPLDEEVDEDLDQHLITNPMSSIFTVKDWDLPEVQEFAENLATAEGISGDIFMAQKINGHGIRLVYKDGEFVKAFSRARASRGRDLTRQMSSVVPGQIDLEGVVEIRGEVCLRVPDLDRAREFTPGLKTPFSAVSSLLKPSSSVEENSLLSFLAYDLYCDERPSANSYLYATLQELGFQTPDFVTMSFEQTGDMDDAIEFLQTEFHTLCESMTDQWFLDGVVCQADDFVDGPEIFEGQGVYRPGALALKVEQFAQAVYTGYVSYIEWKPGRVKLSPVAVLVDESGGDTPGVVTDTGNTVSNVPLYEPVNIYHLQAYPGYPIHFKYGGEAGVVPCFADGTLLTEAMLNDIFVG